MNETFWEAEKKYKDKPFVPFWEKERLLGRMMPKRAAQVAEDDIFLPKFSKDKFTEEAE